MFVSENKKKADILLFYLRYCPWVTIRIIHSTADRAIMQSVWNSTNKYMHKCKCEKSLKNVKNVSLVYGIVSRKYSCWVAGIQRGRPTTTQIDIFLSTHTHLLRKCVHMKIKKQLAKPVTTDNPNCVAIVVNQLHGESCHNPKNFYPSFPHYCKCVHER